jgi:DNA replication factor GINS
MNVDELQSVQSRERQTDQLQQLRETFYEDAGQFIQQLRSERDRAAERAEDPFDSPEVNRLTDDIKTAEQTVEAVYERRVGKIVKMASLAAADMPTEDDGLTREERDLFETMVEAIESNRGHVLDVIAGEAPTGAVGDEPNSDDRQAPDPEPHQTADEPAADTADPPEPPSTPDTGVDAADMMGSGGDQSEPAEESDTPTPPPDIDTGSNPTADSQSDPADVPAAGDDVPVPPAEPGAESDPGPAADPTHADGGTQSPAGSDTAGAADVDRRTVRIMDDVGEIFGVDQREYDLSTDDVVTLPADNADPLVEQDAAEPLE